MAMTLKALRVNKGLDQKTAAEFIGITPETLGKWEQGKTFPNVPQITKIEELYSVSYSDINFLPANIG
ncbi:MAG: helix-turn-helix transcriptional regulator [Lachnospiraceae bacterium]|nr:helix-turn-helix transcriptional regulator [Lachnospiraceae bacterium]